MDFPSLKNPESINMEICWTQDDYHLAKESTLVVCALEARDVPESEFFGKAQLMRWKQIFILPKVVCYYSGKNSHD